MKGRPPAGRGAQVGAFRPRPRPPLGPKASRFWRVVGLIALALLSLAFQPLFWLLYFLWEPVSRRPLRRPRRRPPFRVVRPFGVDLIAPADAGGEVGAEVPAVEWAEIRVDAPVVRDGRAVCLAHCTYRLSGVERPRQQAFRIPASWSDEKVRDRLGRECGLGEDVEISVTRA